MQGTLSIGKAAGAAIELPLEAGEHQVWCEDDDIVVGLWRSAVSAGYLSKDTGYPVRKGEKFTFEVPRSGEYWLCARALNKTSAVLRMFKTS